MGVSTGRPRFLVLGAALLVIVLVLAITGVLNITSFRRDYTDSLVAGYAIPAGAGVGRIEYGLRYGKPVENFFGMEDVLAEVKANAPDAVRALVVLPGGEVRYDQSGRLADERLGPALQGSAAFAADASRADLPVRYGGNYYLLFPIEGPDGSWEGSLGLVFPQDVVDAPMADLAVHLVQLLVMLGALCFLALLLVNRVLPLTTPEGEIYRKRFLVACLTVLALAQGIFGWTSYAAFNEGYRENAAASVHMVANIARQDIVSVIGRGVPYDALYQVDEYLDRMVRSVPEIASMHIRAEDGALLYSTGEVAERPDLAHTLGLTADSTAFGAHLQVDLSAAYLEGRIREIFLDNLTMLVVSMVLMVEAVIFMALLLHSYRRPTAHLGTGRTVEATQVRTVMFLLAIAVFTPAAFIPVLMKELYQPILGLSENVILGLPISAEMLSAGIAAIVAGRALDKGSWQKIVFTGLSIFAIGLLLSYQAGSGLAFIFARAVSGAGYGVLLIALRGFINTRAAVERTEGFSGYVSGLYAGFIIGVVMGAMVADRLGFQEVFLVSLVFALGSGLLARVLLMDKAPASPAHQEPVPGSPGTGSGLGGFFADWGVVGFLLFVVLPFTVAGMFLDYFLPLFAAGEGISTSNVGRAFMVNGLAIAYLGPFLSLRTAKHLGPVGSVILSGVLIAGALLLFVTGNNFAAAFVAVFLLGVSDSFGLVAQHNYFMNLPAAQRLGTGAALGYFDNVRKLGQMMGPLAFGSALALGTSGIGVIAGIALLGGVLFLLTRSRRGDAVAG